MDTVSNSDRTETVVSSVSKGVNFTDLRLEHLVFGTVNSHRDPSLVRLRRGLYLPRALVPADLNEYEVRRFISKARSLSSIAVRRDPSALIVSGEAALQLMGIETWWNSPNIIVRWLSTSKRPSASRVLLPRVKIAGVNSLPVIQQDVYGWNSGAPAISNSGIQIASLEEALVDLVRFSHHAAAFVGVCSAFNQLAGFDRCFPEEGRLREQNLRNFFLKFLDASPSFRGCRWARAIFQAADAGIDSVGKGYIFWLLRCMLAEEIEVFTPYCVTVGGQPYFVDFAFPEHKVIWEFDGVAPSVRTFVDNDFLRRHQDLINGGWIVRHINLNQLNGINSLILMLLGYLHDDGIRASYPSGILWKQPTKELLNQQRRF